MSNSRTVNKVNVVNILGKQLPDGTILEAIYDAKEEKAKLIIKDEGGTTQIANEYQFNNKVYRPLVDNHVLTSRVLLPSAYSNSEEDPIRLLYDVQAEIHKYVDLEPKFEEIAARYVMMTYVYERFQRIPYLRNMGPWGSGKSRFLEVMGALCYHSSLLGVGITPSNIYRWLEKYPGTLIMDEADFGHTEYTHTITQILNSGYERNGAVTRSIRTEEDFTPRTYKTFSPKILACRYPFQDDALESRFITHNSYVTKKTDLSKSIPTFDEWDEMKELRNRLIRYRLDYYTQIRVDTPIHGLKEYEPRLIEIFTPLLLSLREDQPNENIRTFIEHQIEDRQNQLGMSDEGIVGRVAIDLYSERRNASVSVREITERTNRNRQNLYPLSERKVGELLRGLGLGTHRTNKGYILNTTTDNLQSIARRYGINNLGKEIHTL